MSLVDVLVGGVRPPRNEQIRGSIPEAVPPLISANALIRYVPGIITCHFCHIGRCGRLHFVPHLILLKLDA